MPSEHELNKAADNDIADRLEKAVGLDEEAPRCPRCKQERPLAGWLIHDCPGAEPMPTKENEVGHVRVSVHQIPGHPGLLLASETHGLDPVDAMSMMVEAAHQYLDEIRGFATPAMRLAANLHRIAGNGFEAMGEEILQSIIEIGRKHGFGEEVEGAIVAERTMRELDRARAASL